MMKLRKIIFCAAAPVFVVLAAVYLQQKYEPIFAAPEIGHDVLANDRHTLRAVFHPPQARDALAGLVKLPRWVVAPFAPREIALLVEPDLDAQVLRLQIFVNEQRLGPLIERYVNGPAKDAPFVTWDSRGLVREERGFMWLQGSIPLEPEAAALMRAVGARGQAGEPPALEGAHMFEAVLDNNDNGALAAFLSLYACLDTAPPVFDPEVVAGKLSALNEVRISANFDSAGALEVGLTIEGRPGSESFMGELAFLFEVAANEAAKELGKAPYKIGLSRNIERERHILTVTFTLTDVVRFFNGGTADA